MNACVAGCCVPGRWPARLRKQLQTARLLCEPAAEAPRAGPVEERGGCGFWLQLVGSESKGS